MKLYRCEDDDGELEWKKFKDVGCTGYTEDNTNKFTLRSDRNDFYSTDHLEYIGNN